MSRPVPVKQREQTELTVPITQPLELSVHDLIQRHEKIQSIVRDVMKPDVDYGVIPGTERPTLFKSGGEVLAQTFQFSPRYEIRRYEFEEGHVDFEVICRLHYIPTDQVISEGIGSCTTLEPKFCYRRGEPESTGNPVPREYWTARKTKPAKAQELIGGKNFLAKKIDGYWMICSKSEERYENPDIAETYHIVRRMAKKRAFLDAVGTATAASRVFSEEQLDEEQEIEEPSARTGQRQHARPGEMNETATAEKPEPKNYKTALWDALIEAYDKARVPAELKRLTGKNSITDLSEDEARDALLFFEHGDGRQQGEATFTLR